MKKISILATLMFCLMLANTITAIVETRKRATTVYERKPEQLVVKQTPKLKSAAIAVQATQRLATLPLTSNPLAKAKYAFKKTTGLDIDKYLEKAYGSQVGQHQFFVKAEEEFKKAAPQYYAKKREQIKKLVAEKEAESARSKGSLPLRKSTTSELKELKAAHQAESGRSKGSLPMRRSTAPSSEEIKAVSSVSISK